MVDKKLSDTTDQELVLEFVEQLKTDNKRLNEELKKRRRPMFSLNGDGIKRAFNHWTWWMLAIVGCACAITLTLVSVIPSSYETGRFYIQHRGSTCGNCYEIMKEVKGGQDDSMTECISNKDEAYKVANEFADEWKRLKDKSEVKAEHE
ncbi:MAG: hypothetical protein ACXAC5_04400 [Promethearchaeota archaeon]|jgi:hypothetical protein